MQVTIGMTRKATVLRRMIPRKCNFFYKSLLHTKIIHSSAGLVREIGHTVHKVVFSMFHISVLLFILTVIFQTKKQKLLSAVTIVVVPISVIHLNVITYILPFNLKENVKMQKTKTGPSLSSAQLHNCIRYNNQMNDYNKEKTKLFSPLLNPSKNKYCLYLQFFETYVELIKHSPVNLCVIILSAKAVVH